MNSKVICAVLLIALAIIMVAYATMTGKCKEWLKYAVCVAEKELGEKTGQLKLRYVYDMFIEQFPSLASVLPFTIFSKWVDIALEWMKLQLEQNKEIKFIITGPTIED